MCPLKIIAKIKVKIQNKITNQNINFLHENEGSINSKLFPNYK